MTSIDDPEQLRMRGAEMRDRAEKALFPETKQGLLRIADDYDVLAMRAEQRLGVLAKLAPDHDPLVNAAVDHNSTIDDIQLAPTDTG